LAAETGNNTSTSPAFLGSPNGNIAGKNNISKVDATTLLYPGSTTKIYAHLMPWFGGSNHLNVGYASDDPAQVTRQVNDMLSRGLSGAILDWFDDDSASEDALIKRLVYRWAGVLPLDARADAPGGDVETFLGSIAPLAEGEKTLEALPFVLLLH